MTVTVISKFREKPRTRTAWWAMGLGLGTLLTGPILGISAAVLRPIIDRSVGENFGTAVSILVVTLVLSLLIVALVTCVRTYKKGERSWVLWVGFVPAIFEAAMMVLMVVAELVIPH